MSLVRRYLNALTLSDLGSVNQVISERGRIGYAWWRRYLASLFDIPLPLLPTSRVSTTIPPQSRPASESTGLAHALGSVTLAPWKAPKERRGRRTGMSRQVGWALAGLAAAACAGLVTLLSAQPSAVRVRPAATYTLDASPSSTGPTLPASATPLITLLESSLADAATQCNGQSASVPFHPTGMVSAYYCTDSRLPGGGIWAYQMDSESDYQATWVSFNKWVAFDTTSAGTTCPPNNSKNPEGLAIWHNDSAGYPYRTGQVVECYTGGTGSNSAPTYVWTAPTQLCFFVASGASGSKFSDLDTWWQKIAPPKATTRPATSTSP